MSRLDYLQHQSATLHVDALLIRVRTNPAYLPERLPPRKLSTPFATVLLVIAVLAISAFATRA
ncbi:hypothetical protein [Dyella mobilis]|uniref:Uncharacterized protein n=1 Tax=Dyella mobilis TaxID=1849582 RepID=A0ABS2KK93_9GAMM|nr:hypothetical protein [Dyella mobilis]MBM7131587.1 hypothetical protein [Dyella mobilis]GLQ96439.1 hypothetical protein GCM10007863_08570 [Dyella mobilis]